MGVEESGSPMGADWQLRWVFLPEGTHLSNSTATKGAASDLLREDRTNRLLGPTRSFPAEMGDGPGAHSRSEPTPPGTSGARELSTGQQIAADAIGTAEGTAVAVVMQLVVVPAASRGIDKVAKRLRGRTRRTPTEEGAPTPIAAASSRVSAAEYRERFLRMGVAEAQAASEREFLSNARIEDDDIDPTLTRALTLVLEGNLSALNDAEIDVVRRFLEGTRTADGRYVLMRVERTELPPAE